MMNSAKSFPTWTLENDQLELFAYWDDFFSEEECDKVMKLSKTFKLEDSKIGTTGEENKSIRNSKISFIHPTPDTFWMYEKLTRGVIELNNSFFKFDLFSFGEGLQFTEYKGPSGKFDKHVDRVFNGPVRKLSIIVQLSDENAYTGGNIELFEGDKPITLSRKRGTLLAFPSFVMHRVSEVTSGKRNSIVGWINGKPFR